MFSLLGQLVNKMRAAHVKHAFLTTYNYTVFVKRASGLSFLISRPFRDDLQDPSLRELFVGFCLMAMSDPKYWETHPDTATIVSAYILGDLGIYSICRQLLTYTKVERYFQPTTTGKRIHPSFRRIASPEDAPDHHTDQRDYQMRHLNSYNCQLHGRDFIPR
jgi:hypothetical protein